MSQIDKEAQVKEQTLKTIDWILLSVVLVVLLLTGLMLRSNLLDQNAAYDQVIKTALKITEKDPNRFIESNTAVLAFSRAKDFANMKAASTFLGFLLVFTGALYLLKVFNLSYKLKADKTPVGNVALESTSPGLVMITLGVAIIIVVLVTKTEVDYDVDKKIDVSAAQAKVAQLDSQIQGLEKILSHAAPQKTTGEKLNVEVDNTPVSDSTFFSLPSGVALKTPQNMVFVKKLAKKLKDNPDKTLNLEGESDQGSTIEKLKKAKDLANSLKNMLEDMGIASARIRVKSYGESPNGPAFDNWKKGIKITIK